MAYHRGGQIPHAFAYSPPRSDRSPDRSRSPASPAFSTEDPQSPITPLWAMGSFVTSASFARSPVSVSSTTPFDWAAAAFPFPPIKESDDEEQPRPRHRREHASTDLDKSPGKPSKSLDMTAGSMHHHRRSKSHAAKRSIKGKHLLKFIADVKVPRMCSHVPRTSRAWPTRPRWPFGDARGRILTLYPFSQTHTAAPRLSAASASSLPSRRCSQQQLQQRYRRR